MRVLNHILMAIIGVVVLWSLIGISAKQVGENTQYSFFIKSQPSVQLWYEQK